MWTKIITSLLDSGLTQQEIASRVGVAQASISDLKSGKTKQPNWQLGDDLLRLHKQRSRKQAA
jgi:transcriptional regulator with XRE-family HTH domain